MKNVWMMVVMVFLVACSSGESAEQAASGDGAAPQAAAEPSGSVVPAAGDWGSMILGGAKCVTAQEGQTATVYFKGDRMRMDTTPSDAHAIYDSDTIYAWSGAQGTKMSRKDVEKMAQQAGQGFKSQEQVAQEMQDPNVNCAPASVSDDLFVPPADVQFMDLGEMLKQQYGAQLPQ